MSAGGGIDGVDLNLLKPLAALLDERSVSRAAIRAHMSQPAMSRTLQRLRKAFKDDLLVRGTGGYELTPAGERIRRQLATLLPDVADMFGRGPFAPAGAAETFRVAGSDYAATVLGDPLFRDVLRQSPRSRLHYRTWHDSVFDELDHGRLDLAFCGVIPSGPLRAERLFDERFVCVLSSDHPLAGRPALDLEEYLGVRHVVVDVSRGEQGVVDADLRRAGRRRSPALTVPYHSAALHVVPGTDFVATMPERLVHPHDGIRVAAVPPQIGVMAYAMVWHPRLDTDPAQHWLRDRARAAAGPLTRHR
ncbi:MULTISPECIES: LysR family transcriptional regulator [Catenuloplanes]|uniref:DNA-binding transcriptional LysR family regulator n=1 Tax=Catenuloplanes niger TaxID=587534 RepID=A0AAE4CTI2_9ACTN|nr:LysR family transcriptional regulator [Catenuloplanes niger]MDR7320744.1 DNA-binding transcriptional LysR family regulator [Catenuloplanes niger]